VELGGDDLVDASPPFAKIKAARFNYLAAFFFLTSISYVFKDT